MQMVQHPFSMQTDPDTKMPQLPGFDQERQQLANAMAGDMSTLNAHAAFPALLLKKSMLDQPCNHIVSISCSFACITSQEKFKPEPTL